jgi:hypothetical protein
MLAGSAADRFALRAVSLTGLNRLLSCRRTEVKPVLERLLAPAPSSSGYTSGQNLEVLYMLITEIIKTYQEIMRFISRN